MQRLHDQWQECRLARQAPHRNLQDLVTASFPKHPWELRDPILAKGVGGPFTFLQGSFRMNMAGIMPLPFLHTWWSNAGDSDLNYNMARTERLLRTACFCYSREGSECRVGIPLESGKPDTSLNLEGGLSLNCPAGSGSPASTSRPCCS